MKDRILYSRRLIWAQRSMRLSTFTQHVHHTNVMLPLYQTHPILGHNYYQSHIMLLLILHSTMLCVAARIRRYLWCSVIIRLGQEGCLAIVVIWEHSPQHSAVNVLNDNAPLGTWIWSMFFVKVTREGKSACPSLQEMLNEISTNVGISQGTVPLLIFK